MSRRPALRALADRLGIVAGYEPAGGGATRPTSDATRERLVTALGHDASSEANARRSLAALREAERARTLPPVCLGRPGRPGRLPVRRASGQAFAWELAVAQEDGAVRERSGRAPRGATLPLPPLPPGMHRARVRVRSGNDTLEGDTTLVVAPTRCTPVAERLRRRRAFGLWTHLYTLRSEHSLGVGDLGDLARLVRFAGRLGASFVGLNPLHALRNRPPHVSPYSPLSRLFRNALYLDPTAVPEWKSDPEARERLARAGSRRVLEALRRAERVDYARVTALRRPLLEALFRAFRHRHAGGDTARGRAFAAFRSRHGGLLERFATFCALDEWHAERGLPSDWRRWRRGLHSPDAPAVQEFARAHAERVELHVFLQFELERQLATAAGRAARAGLALGLYQDLALGSDATGFDTWAFPELFVAGARVGAPPDLYAAAGQDWGLPPLHPERLSGPGLAYWARLLRAGFGHAGLLRIDHVMGLFRQWWVPLGRPASEGAYVRFPAELLLAVLALESRRARAVVVGEDLGTVPRGLPARLARAGVLSSRVLLFERDRRGGFRPSARYSRRALVTANTHDLPTLAGWWSGRDLELRRVSGALTSDRALAAARSERARERRALLRRLVAEGLLAAKDSEPAFPELSAAVHAFLARTPAPLVGVALDDLAGEVEPLNLPGVSAELHPSWTRRMRLPLERLVRDAGVRRAARGLSGRRAPRR